MCRHRRAPLVFLAMLLAVAVVLSACQPAAAPTATPKPAVPPTAVPPTAAPVKPIKVGLGEPLTGALAFWGNNYAEAARMAVEDINAAGGVLGRPLELVVMDDQGDPKQSVVVAHNFCSNAEIVAFYGFFGSGNLIPSEPVFNECRMPVLGHGSNPKVTEAGYDDIFQTWPNDLMQGIAPAEYLFSKGAKSAAIIHDKNMYGEGIATEFQKQCQKLGIKVTSFQGFNPADVDFTPLLTKIKAEDPDILFHGGYTEIALILKQARALGMRQTVVSGDSAPTGEVADAAGDAVVGLIGASGAPAYNTTPRSKEFAERLAKRLNIPKQDAIQMNYTYDGMFVIADAIKRAGSADREAIIKALRTTEYDGLFRHISWDAKGRLKEPYMFLAEWRKDTAGKYFVEIVYKWVGDASVYPGY